MFKGIVNLKSVDREAFELPITGGEAWVQDFLCDAAPDPRMSGLGADDWAAAAKISGDVRVEKLAHEYLVSGRLQGEVAAPCSRCGDRFAAPRSVDFKTFLRKIEAADDEEDQDSGDPDYLFIEGEEIDLRALLTEQLVVAEPIAECPAKKADGSCALCHKNPENEAAAGSNKTLQVPEKRADSPFSKLAVLKRRS